MKIVVNAHLVWKQCQAIRRRSDVIRTLSQHEQPRKLSLRSQKCQLQQNIDKAGLRLGLNVPKDGNCPFHAISDQLKRLKLHRYRHGELREKAVNQLRPQPIIRQVSIRTLNGCNQCYIEDTSTTPTLYQQKARKAGVCKVNFDNHMHMPLLLLD